MATRGPPKPCSIPQAMGDISMSESKVIGATIRRLRKERGLSQHDLAAAIGWERGTIAPIEAGHSLPGRELVQALAQFFQTSADTILGRAGQHQPASAQTDDEAEVLTLFREADQRGKAAVLATLRAVTNSGN